MVAAIESWVSACEIASMKRQIVCATLIGLQAYNVGADEKSWLQR